jgi:hypothetical protein
MFAGRPCLGTANPVCRLSDEADQNRDEADEHTPRCFVAALLGYTGLIVT